MESIFGLLWAFFQLLGKLLFDWWGWVPLVAVLGYFVYQNTRRSKFIAETQHSLLLIEVPKDNDKREPTAEQMFASLHEIIRPKSEILRAGVVQEHISFEIVAFNNKVHFYVWTPKHLQKFVQSQIQSHYPDVNIEAATEDYTRQALTKRGVQGAELSLTNNDVLPIKVYKDFEADPISGITAALAKLEQTDEQVWIQILARPLSSSWKNKGDAYIKRLSGTNKNPLADNFWGLARDFFVALIRPPQNQTGSKAPPLSEIKRDQAEAAKAKTSKLGFEVKIRIVHIGDDRTTGRLRIQSILGAFKQYNDTNNGFKLTNHLSHADAIEYYRARLFVTKGFALNVEELASLFHFPHSGIDTPSTVWSATKTAQPPSNLPTTGNTTKTELSPLGTANLDNKQTTFGLKREDRERHLYIIGQTGTGKSYLLELLTLSDIHYNHGFGLIDPHGDVARHVLRYIPKKRIADVIYFRPADADFPIAFNPMEVGDPALKGQVSSEIVGVFKRMFGQSWGSRHEYILRYCILALLDTPGSTLLGITRMLSDKSYRESVTAQIGDPVVRNFWVNEFDSWNDKFAAEAVSPILNKVGAFVSNPLIRNILGQPNSSINFREIMDEGKILVVNLSRGQVGEDNATALGALLVSQIQLAAISRADTESEKRRPFYLYVDEFQNFTTDSFSLMLGDARKYGLNLTVANQYVSQMTSEIRDAVFGNIGNTLIFRVGADDARYLAKYVEPAFDAQDLIRLHNRHFVVSMSIEGEKVPPFPATTLNVPSTRNDYSQDIIAMSQQHYGTHRANVEEYLSHPAHTTSQVDISPTPTNSPQPMPGDLAPHKSVKLR